MATQRLIEFVLEGNLLRTVVDGKKVPDVHMDVKVIRDSVRSKTISPAMRDGILKRIAVKLQDHVPGISTPDIQRVVKRYEEEFNR